MPPVMHAFEAFWNDHTPPTPELSALPLARRHLVRPFADTSLHAVVAGFVAMMTGYASSLVLIFQAGRAAQLSNAQISSWIWALPIGMALSTDRPLAALSRAGRHRVVDAGCGAPD